MYMPEDYFHRLLRYLIQPFDDTVITSFIDQKHIIKRDDETYKSIHSVALVCRTWYVYIKAYLYSLVSPSKILDNGFSEVDHASIKMHYIAKFARIYKPDDPFAESTSQSFARIRDNWSQFFINVNQYKILTFCAVNGKLYYTIKIEILGMYYQYYFYDDKILYIIVVDYLISRRKNYLFERTYDGFSLTINKPKNKLQTIINKVSRMINKGKNNKKTYYSLNFIHDDRNYDDKYRGYIKSACNFIGYL